MGSKKTSELLRRRLMNQQIAASTCTTPQDVVTRLAAMQAQDYPGALWSIGLRLPGATLADVRRAVAERTIVRTWPMRGTLHFVAAGDVVWMLDLLASRALAGSAARRRQLGLDAKLLGKVEKVWVRALSGGQHMTRVALRTKLARAKIDVEGPQLSHCIGYLAHNKVLCCGLPEGKQLTFTLLDEWIPHAKSLPREAALVELAARYFAGHGPATQQDLMRWAGVNGRDAKLGIEGATPVLSRESSGGTDYFCAAEGPQPTAAARGAFLLPGFDEYVLGYKDRSSFLPVDHSDKIVPGNNGIFRPTMVLDGQVIGLWKAVAKPREVRVSASAFAPPLTKAQRAALAGAVERYGHYLGRTAVLDG